VAELIAALMENVDAASVAAEGDKLMAADNVALTL
jgi:hypothetical protein